MRKTVLILGASGRFGRNIATPFEAAGWLVRGFRRGTDDLDAAAQGADVIANGWNPPYHRWAAELPGLHAQVRRAALRHECTVLLPGNVYVFGRDAGVVWRADTPHRATNRLGRLRIELEAAYRDEGVRTILLRGGDFLDTEASGQVFDRLMAHRIARGVLHYPGRLDVPHAWAYLPDFARAFQLLAEARDGLPRFADIPFPGHTLTGAEVVATLERVTGRPLRVRPVPWWLLRLVQPAMPVLSGTREMRYLWDIPHRLDGARFSELLPDFRATSAEEALAAAAAPLLPRVPARGVADHSMARSTQTSL
ncbi:Rossmann-fold NAD(P)-binding domain-containing protein [Roseovarius salinarum]|uniref:epimerase n=1 Tax=Roseovarius salinarum TaxID=1981892 RepID=UPI001E508FF3|nr:epimerase [Roseovarius salinarum]